MPSKSEPCGLSQMIASRYGSIPVVRETGGLYDSIKHYSIDENGEIDGNGFTFAEYSGRVLKGKIEEALELYADKDLRKRMTVKIMKTDFSWSQSAQKYLEMYEI